jgi:hypothetical protein
MNFSEICNIGKYKIFKVEFNGLICKACNSSFSFSKRFEKYINVPALPHSLRDIDDHLKSTTHRIGSASYCKKLKMESGVLTKKNFCLKEIHKDMDNLSENEVDKFTLCENSNSSVSKNNNEDSLSSNEMSLIPTITEKMRVCMWLAKGNIANNHFSSLQNLINTVGDNELLKVFGHNSQYSFSEFSDALFLAYKNFLVEQISTFKLFALTVDDSEIQKKNEICIFIRYINPNVKVVTSFLAIREIGLEGATAKNLFNIIQKVLEEFNIDIRNMISFCSDGASNMRGVTNGLVALFKESIPDLIDFHCAAHRFNLVIQQSIQDIPTVIDCANDAGDISVYVNGSPNRLSHLHDIQSQLHIPTKQILLPTAIRWSSTYNCIHSITDQFLPILILLHDDSKNSPSKKVSELFQKMSTIQFISNISVIDVVLEKLNTTILKLQTENIDMGMVYDCIHHLLSKLSQPELNLDVYNRIEDLKKAYAKFKESEDFKLVLEEVNPSEISNLTQNFIKNIVKNINNRFEETEIFSSFINIFHPAELNKLEKNEDKWHQKKIIYANLVRHFKERFSEIRYNQKIQDYTIFQNIFIKNFSKHKSALDICTNIIEDHRFAPAVTLVRLAQIFLLTPASSSCVEGGFSIVNEIKSDIRNKMGSKMLNFVMICQNKVMDDVTDDILEKAAVIWFKGEKKRRYLSCMCSEMYRAGIIDAIPPERKFFWREGSSDKLNSDDIDNKVKEPQLSALMIMEKYTTTNMEYDVEECRGGLADVEYFNDVHSDSDSNTLTFSHVCKKKKKKKEKEKY